jgi:RimJ/RimL family protein N-acetyltransferase
MSKYIYLTPWDSRALGIDTYEIIYESTEQLKQSLHQIQQENKAGHYTVKIDPLASKRILHEFGFYYCDTMVEPYCTVEFFIPHVKEGIELSQKVDFQTLLNICHGAFIHDRFHKDFNIERHLADIRYDLWLKDLWEAKQVFGLMYFDEVVGFWGFSKNKIVLHAMSERYRGKGLSKYFWSCACQALFEKKYTELVSSISISNLAVLNLYASLGFRFRRPVDVYHCLLGD